jgi:hypothetical protein
VDLIRLVTSFERRQIQLEPQVKIGKKIRHTQLHALLAANPYHNCEVSKESAGAEDPTARRRGELIGSHSPLPDRLESSVALRRRTVFISIEVGYSFYLCGLASELKNIMASAIMSSAAAMAIVAAPLKTSNGNGSSSSGNVVSAFTGLKSTAQFPSSMKTNNAGVEWERKTTSNGGRVRCMQVGV